MGGDVQASPRWEGDLKLSTQVLARPVDDPAVWTAAEVTKETFAMPLSEAEIDALEDCMRKSADKHRWETTKEEFSHPLVLSLIERVWKRLTEESGVAILTGLTRDRFSDDEMERIYWGIGTHLGQGQPQNPAGDMIGYVQREETNPTDRGYRSAAELSMHTDNSEVVGLMCVQRAETGGESSLASALAVHNRIVEERPDLMQALYDGYYFWLPEKREGIATTDEKLPVFCNIDGKVSCNFAGTYMRKAADLRQDTLSPELDEAIDLFSRLVNGPEMRAEFMLDPGDMMLWNNYVLVHSRQSFEDSPERKRKLLRLWLKTEGDMRPVTERFRTRERTLKRMYDRRAG